MFSYRPHIIAFLLLVWSAYAPAQSAKADSLRNVIDQSSIDSVKGNAYHQLGNLTGPNDSISLLYYDSAFYHFGKQNLPLKQFNSLMNKGLMSYNFQLADTIDAVLQRAQTFYDKNKIVRTDVNSGKLFMLKGYKYYLANELKPALENFISAKNLYSKSGEIRLAANTCTFIAMTMSQNDEFEKGIEYIEQAAGYYRQLNDSTNLYNELINLAGIFLNLKQYEKSKKYMDEAKQLIYKAATEDMIASYYKAVAVYEMDFNDNYTAALENFNKALQYVSTDSYYDKAERADIYEFMGKMFYHRKNFAAAIEKAKMSINLYKEKGSQEELISNYQIIALSYKGTGNYAAAYEYLDTLSTVKDSITNQRFKNELIETERKYNIKEKNIEIENLKKANSAERKIKFQYGVLALVTLLGSSVLILYIRNRRKLHRQQLSIQKAKVEQLEKEKQVASLEYLIKGQEEERTRVAKDLHDGLGGMLSGVKMSLSKISGQEQPKELFTIVDQLDQSIRELRYIAHNMMPEALLRFGLDEALKNLCSGLNQSKQINISYQSYGWNGNISKDYEVILYRIVQELINNAVKHGKPKNILVQLIESDNHISLTVEDDGTGYVANNPDVKKGIGLSNIESRVQYLNATMDIQSERGTGTTVNIEMNMTNEKY
jgi:two-component system, NarL family, sensor kinase